MRRQFEDLKYLCPIVCAIMGWYIRESSLVFPWQILASALVSLSAVYVIRTTWRIDKREKVK